MDDHDTTTRDMGLDLGTWEGPAIGLMDLDAFFASVEQLDHPEWRGRPVIVGGSPERRGVVSTASYEARRFGVHSAMPSSQAARLCPAAIWTRGNFARYHEVSQQVMAIIGNETPLVEQVSIDEAFFDVTPGRFSHESPIDICQRIRERVSTLGITCSIGLGVNKTVAKIASEREKPRGLTVVLPGMERSFLAPLPVTAMSGIGSATAAHLGKLRIKTLGDLARQDPERMAREFGVNGPRMVTRAAGLERSCVREQAAEEDAKSVSNERTFSTDLTQRADIEAAIRHVAAITGRRMRKRGLKGTTVTLKLKFDALSIRTAQRRLASPTFDEHVFGECAVQLLGDLWKPGISVRLVGVGMSGFDDRDRVRQLELFPTCQDGEKDVRPQRDLLALSEVTDRLRDRFGDDIVSYGREMRLEGRASDTAPRDKSDF